MKTSSPINNFVAWWKTTTFDDVTMQRLPALAAWEQQQTKIDELESALSEKLNTSMIAATNRIIELESKVKKYALRVGDKLERIDELEKGIKDFITGEYPHPRNSRPDDCPHNVSYWNTCDECDIEHLQGLLKVIE